MISIYDNPSTTMAVTWRCDISVTDGYVEYRKDGDVEYKKSPPKQENLRAILTIPVCFGCIWQVFCPIRNIITLAETGKIAARNILLLLPKILKSLSLFV